MMTFWVVAAFMILAGLAFVVLPLSGWRAKEGEKSAGGRAGVFIAVATMPVVAMAMYLWLGSLDAVEMPPAGRMVANATGAASDAQTPPNHPQTGAAGGEAHGVDEMAAKLEERLAKNPEDAEGWVLLGRTYGFMKQHQKAVAAFRKARALKGDDPQLLADLAEALGIANGDRMAGEPAKLTAEALAKAPTNAKALWLTGVVHMQSGRREEAARTWEKLRSQLPPDGQEATALAGYIAQLRQPDAPAATSAAPADDGGGKANSAGSAVVRVRVSLDPKMASKAAPDDKVFVYARATEGPRMPLAIVQKQVRDLPADIELNESQAMAPGMSLARFPKVIVGARISKSGDALAKPGDLEGSSGPITVGGKDAVAVRIAAVVQ